MDEWSLLPSSGLFLFSVEQPEVNPMEVKKIIEEVVEARKTEVDNRGDWDEEEAREAESEC